MRGCIRHVLAFLQRNMGKCQNLMARRRLDQNKIVVSSRKYFFILYYIKVIQKNLEIHILQIIFGRNISKRDRNIYQAISPLAPCNIFLAPCDTFLAPFDTFLAPCDTFLAPCDTVLAQCDTCLAPCDTFLAPYDTFQARDEQLLLQESCYCGDFRR